MSIIKVKLNYCARCNCQICKSINYKKEINIVDETHHKTTLRKFVDMSKFCECEKPMSSLIFISYMDSSIEDIKKYIAYYDEYDEYDEKSEHSMRKDIDTNLLTEKLKEFISSGIEYKVNYLTVKSSEKYYVDTSYIKTYINIVERFEDCDLNKITCVNFNNISYIFIEEDRLSNLEDYKNYPSLIYAEAFMLFSISKFMTLFYVINKYKYDFDVDDYVLSSKKYEHLQFGFATSITSL